MVSTPSVPPDRPEDPSTDDPTHDPTGVRALLRGLSEPGPMPDDLVQRITASIAAEEQARAGSTGTVVPMRRRRVWPQVAAVAAAVAMVAIAVPAALSGNGAGDLVSSLRGEAGHDAASSASTTAESGVQGAAPTSVAPRTEDGTPDARVTGAVGTITLTVSGTAYTSAGLTTQAQKASEQVKGTHAQSAPGTRGPADTDTGLRACLTALGVAAWHPIEADLASYEGTPAVIAIVVGDTGRVVYAVPPDCDAAHPRVLAGPLTMP